METTLPVALSTQMAMEKRLDTIANNIANSRTAGFRAEEIKFDELISRSAKDPVSFASEGSTYLSTRAGELTETGNPLDLAATGEGFFAVQSPRGTVYTRDGRMRINTQGGLESLNGYAVLDVGGAPLQIDPTRGPIQIAQDGMMSQGGLQIGAVGLFTMAPGANLTRTDNSGVIPDRAAVPVVDFNGTEGVKQGFVEGSNVNPMLELSRLISLQRTFESASNMVQTTEQSLQEAIRSLGSRS